MIQKKQEPQNEADFIPAMGAVDSPHDYRTVQLDMADAVEPGKIPESYRVAFEKPPCNKRFHQRNIGMCTMCAVAGSAEEFFKDGVELSRAWGYLMGKVLIDDPAYGQHFEGSSAFTMLKTANKYGIPEMAIENAYPLAVLGTYADFIAHFKKTYGGKIPKAVMDSAAKHKIPGYAQVKVNPLDLATMIQGAPGLVIRMAVGNEWWTNKEKTRFTWNPADILPLRPANPVTSGHLIIQDGYVGVSAPNPVITIINSWGDQWAEAGKGYFNFNDQKGFFTEAWIIKGVAPEIITRVKDMPAAKDFKYTFKKPLVRGNTGAEVKQMQIALCALGHLDIMVDELGTYGPKTARAVYAFQVAEKVASAKELTALRGETWGPATRAAMNKYTEKGIIKN